MRRLVALGVFVAGCSGAGEIAPTPDDDASIDDAFEDGDAPRSDAPIDDADDAAPQVARGLRAEYFADYHDLAISRVEAKLAHDWKTEGPGSGVGKDRFSARWTGTLVPPKSGSYRIITDNDDGVRVFVDDALVIDDWNGHFVQRKEGTVTLSAGVPAKLRIEYFEIDLEASIKLSWSTDGIAETVIPESAFGPAPKASGLPAPKPPYANPVMPFDCPDPGVVVVPEIFGGPRYYAACTGGSFPIRTSRDLVFWKDAGAAILPSGKAPWSANGGRNWAPEIHKVGDRYVAYYTAVNGADVLSIGAASSSTLAGPWVDRGSPLIEHPDGAIDASFFEDEDGSRWLLWKIDGNAHGRKTPILVRRLAPDGLSFAPGSVAKTVLVNDLAWEGGVVEAPWVVKRGGFYYLFYSGNVYDARYRTGVARAKKLDDPASYEKRGAPILANNERWVGPGHGSVVRVGTKDYFVYHAWPAAKQTQRHVLVDEIVWKDGWPAIHDGTPSRTPRPWPGL